jgi:hypothetical protein
MKEKDWVTTFKNAAGNKHTFTALRALTDTLIRHGYSRNEVYAFFIGQMNDDNYDAVCEVLDYVVGWYSTEEYE